MIRGIYAAASGMIADQSRLDVLSNNLANASTSGFKKDTAIGKNFHDILVDRVGDRTKDGEFASPVPIGRLGLGSFILQTGTRLSSGSLRHTGSMLDVAIMGDGFFTVQTPQGIRYTRQGSFVQDAEGRLSTPEGHLVLVDGQPIGEKGMRLEISDEGDVLQDGISLGKLDVATSAEIGNMRKEGSVLWVRANIEDAVQLVVPQRDAGDPRGPFQLRSGFLESSNVEPVLEMVDLITTMRSYESNQKAIHTQDETLGKTVNEVGRL